MEDKINGAFMVLNKFYLGQNTKGFHVKPFSHKLAAHHLIYIT